ncbi:MAG: kelch repeat-containing protein [Planctomycetota bacterium]
MKHKINILKSAFLAVLLVTAGASNLWGHFLFVYGEDGKIKVVFGEGLEPDQAQFLGGIAGMKATTMIDGKVSSVEFEKMVNEKLGWLETDGKNAGKVVNISCPYGVFGRGDKTMFLDYNAKYIRGFDNLKSLKPTTDLSLDVIPTLEKGQLVFHTYFQGKPVKEVEILLEYFDSELSDAAWSDDSGKVTLNPITRIAARAKYVVEESGEVDGKKYAEKRYYCTVVIDTATPLKSTQSIEEPAAESKVSATMEKEKRVDGISRVTLSKVENNYADFPKGMTSFGAAVVNGQVFVVGGKSGRAHRYAKSYQNRDVLCLNLTEDNSDWESAGENLGLQGLALVPNGNKVIRIGGLEARNQEGEEHDLHSIADVLSFDTQTKQWTEMPSLPSGRSSLDACVTGNKVYVVGGWAMNGESGTSWADDMLVLDLTDEVDPETRQWKSIKAPFQTRALAAGTVQEKVVVVGGIKKGGGATAEVHIFDTQTNHWTVGPELPTKGMMKAFGCSATTVGEHLLVSTYDGEVFCLSSDMKSWDKIHQLEFGRFFHRMLPISENQFALIGGSHMQYGSQNEVEVFELNLVSDN